VHTLNVLTIGAALYSEEEPAQRGELAVRGAGVGLPFQAVERGIGIAAAVISAARCRELGLSLPVMSSVGTVMELASCGGSSRHPTPLGRTPASARWLSSAAQDGVFTHLGDHLGGMK
jgi:hypothetical protein